MLLIKIMLMLVVVYFYFWLSNPLDALDIKGQLLAKGEHKLMATVIGCLPDVGALSVAFIVGGALWRWLAALTL